MKRNTIMFITSMILTTAPILHAYPSEIYIKNNTTTDISLFCMFINGPSQLSADKQRINRSLKPHATDLLKIDAPGWVAITINIGTSDMFIGMQPRNNLSFDKNMSGPLYLIYTDRGISTVSAAEWDT